MKLTGKEEVEAEKRGMGIQGAGCSQEVGRMPETVKSADVISAAVNEDYSACQRDICSENLIISISCFLFFFCRHGLLLSLLCFPSASQSVHVLQSIWGLELLGTFF